MIFFQQPEIRRLRGNQFYQIPVACQSFTEQNQFLFLNPEFTAENRLDTCFYSFLIKKYSSVKISGIRHSNCILSGFPDVPDKFLNPAGTIRKTVFTMYMQMYKFFLMHK